MLKSGAGYLPLDPANPAERLAYIVGDAGAPVVLTTSALSGVLEGRYEGELLLLDQDAALFEAAPESDPEVAGSPENLIYTIYTSGSTGRPKGVALTHANVVRLLSSAYEHYVFDESDVWPLFHSYAFDVSVWEMWGALLHGGRLVVVPFAVTRSPEEFLDLLVEEGVTVLNQTPTAFRSLVNAARDGDPRIGRLRLRAVVFAGEKLDVAELKPWTDRIGLDQTALVNMYGITETTVHTTYHRLTEPDLDPQAGNPIGRPLPDLRICLLDPRGELVPVGVAGEIYVGGPGVARGYLGRPELTAERFVPDPFGPAGSRLYKSGDLARRLPDGKLEFLGRIDDQVKIRGFRIELGEIETALAAQPLVRDAVVVVREDEPGDKRLVAYVTAGDQAPTPGELRAPLTADLPEYMIPSAFVVLDALPLTTNGKLDKRALPAPGQDALGGSAAYTAPRTGTEERIAAVWREVLGLERVGVDDSFFDLGGHSLRAVNLVGRLRLAGFDVAVRDVFQHRTVARLAELVTGRGTIEATSAVEPYALISADDRDRLPAGTDDAYPVSQVQLGMLVEMLVDEGGNNYHNATTFRIRDERPFEAEALREAARLVTARHDVLRTGFDLTSYSVPLQIVHTEAELPVEVRDLTALDATAVDRDLRAFMARERATLFDLETPALLRVAAHVTQDGWWFTITECHAVLEGWSHHSLLMELLGEYARIRDGHEHTPHPAGRPAVRFADFIAAELAALDSEEDRGYWNGVVTGFPSFTLPDGLQQRAGLPAATHQSAVALHDLEPRLRALAAEAEVSLKSVLHAAHLTVLSRLTDEDSFVSGLVCDARPEAAGADRVYGMYLNTLPFAHRRGARTWGELVRQVFDRETEMWGHRRYPLPAIQRDAGTGGRRLFDVFFNYQDFEQVDTDLVDYLASIDDSPTEFPLTVATRSGYCILTAAGHALSQENTERLADMYRSVLTAMAESGIDGDATLRHLPAGEYELLVADWNRPRTAPDARRVHEVFEEQVGRTPDAVAVSFEGVELSYAELNARANRIAHVLRGRGVGPEALVGVCLERGLDLIPGILGVLKSGAGYLPLDPANPAERLAYIVGDAGAPVVLTTSALSGVLEGRYEGELLLLDQDAALFEAAPESDPEVAGSPENLIYTIYTSGSTGRPKGVALTHANVLRLLTTARGHYGFAESDVWPLFHSYAFDVSVWEMWGALLHGGRLVVVPFAVTRSPEEFLDLLVEEGVTVLNQTPTAFRSLVNAARDGDPRIGRLRLRAVVFAGEKLDVAELKPWTDRIGLGQTALVNMYGITETTVHTTYHRLTEPDLDPQAGNPIGSPLSDLQICLLDRRGELVPVGVAGEIYVGGPGVARGYLGRPELTAERFVPDPFGPAGSRLYKSGDLARRLPDGKLEFLGRIDDQVKIRGFRIELGEIETALAAQPLVRDAVVVVREDEPGEKRLVAYLTAGEQAPVPGELRGALAAGLPEYMIPSAFVVLDALPLTTNGKLDKRALPAPGQEALGGSAAYTAPRTGTEERIAAVWREVLGLEKVGVEDSFFDLGGDSIRAVSLVGRLRADGFGVSVREVMEHNTVARLAELVTGRPAADDPGFTAVEPYALISAEDRERLPAGTDDAYPVSQVQLGMVLELLADSARNNYHNVNSFLVRDEEPFDEAALRGAVRAMGIRHEALRTSFDLTSYSVPLQIVHTEAEIAVTVGDLRAVDGDRQDALVREFVAAEREVAFDVAQAPLIRVAAHLVSDGAWRLTLTQCHAITEGWSYHTLLMELVEAYRALREGAERVTAEPLPVRFADFVAAELDALASAEDRAHWSDLVTRNARFTLPAHWSDDPAVPRTRTGVRLPVNGLGEGLRALAAEAGVPLKAVFHAAHLKVMSQLTDEASFFTGIVAHGRLEVPGGDRVYGMHVNTLPFAYERGARTWRELVRQVFAHESAMWGHRHFPYPEIQRLAGGGRLVDVVFNFLDFHMVDENVIDTAGSIHDAPTEFGLNVSVLGGLLGISTNNHVLTQPAVERVGAMFAAVLESMASRGGDGDAGEVYLPPGEAESLAGFAGSVEGPDDRPFPVLFGAQVVRGPGAPAVVFEGSVVSYAELEVRANRLARYLVGVGVGPECVVAISMERSVELVVGLLGIMKAGGAYLPLDPGYPVERLAYMLADSGAPVLLTQEGLLGRLPEHGARVVCVDRDAEAIAAESGEAPEVELSAQSTAYVIYTSGSTGRPKGVAVTHAGVGNLAAAQAGHLRVGEGSRVLQFASISFDAAFWELAQALLNGAALVLAPAERIMPGPELTRLTAEQSITHVTLPPTALTVMPADGGLPAATTLVVAGEACTPDLVEAWSAGRRMINGYGPTEATVCSSWSDALEGAVVPPIGRALPNTRLYVLDRDMRQVPVGVPGELFIGGSGLARGYLGRPELTAERFVPDPFGAGEPGGSRLYRSGDLVRYDEQGQLHFLGRIDHQVKVRGYRVELGEIEAALAGQEGVRDAVVAVRAGQLAAYVVLAADAPGVTELRSAIGESLPDYMVPASFTVLDALPLNGSGKVDKKALPAPDLTAFTASERFVAPRSVTEQRIAEVWQQVLGLDKVGVEDSFFDLGGDSIRAVTLVGALRAAGYDIGVREVFDARTVAAVAETVTGRPAPAATEAPVRPYELISADDRALLPAGLDDAYPLSQVQLGMVVELLSDESRARYHNVSVNRIRDGHPFDAPALQEATRIVLARHEVLRTSFALDTYSVPMQLVHSTASVDVTVRDLRGLDEAGREAALAAFAAEEQNTLFDLTRAPLLRVAALVESDTAWRLALTESHAITEGWSYHALMMELLDVYAALRDGREPAAVVPAAVRFADFVAAERKALDSAESRGYWQQTVEEHTKFELPPSWGGSEEEPRETYQLRVPLHDLEPGLRALATDARASLKAVLLSAHLKVLSQLTDEARLFAGVVTDTRPEALGADRVLGMYVNTVPFAYERGARTWRELVRATFDREIEAWEHRQYPMPAMQREAGGRRLVDVVFNYQDFRNVDTELVDVEAGVGTGAIEFGLAVTTLGGYLNLKTDTRSLGRADAERLAAMYRAVLESMASRGGDGDAGEVYLPPGEAESLAAFADGGAGTGSEGVPFPVLFGAQVVRGPGAPAVVFEGSVVSYAELEVRANRLARYLVGVGVGPECVVAISMERSVELVVGLLGIMKAGGAYLPLDPGYPVERLAYMLADSGAPVLLTQEGLLERLPEHGARVVCVDRDAEAIAAESGEAPEVELSAQSTAYVIYTSGSTGRPKGVAVTHQGIGDFADALRDSFGAVPGSRVLQFASISFDAAFWELAQALLNGAALVLAPAERIMPGPELTRLTAEQGVTHAILPPTALTVMPADGGLPAGMTLVVGGEACTPDLVEAWSVGRRMVNAYGPTEATVAVTWSDALEGAVVPPIGRALPNTRLYVLDRDMRQVPVGVPGELFIGGSGLARGYLGRPELTAERFVPDPFGEGEPGGSRLYRSGDLVRYDEQGQLHFLGRIDHQVKVRGYRVELGEIEAALAGQEGVRDAVVAVRAGQLAAYVVLAADAPGVTELRSAIGESLPDYMVPASFTVLDALPLNGSGKVDKKALPAPDLTSFTASERFVAPRSVTEQRIAEVWQQVLGLDKVGVEDSFFDLGGDSIRAVTLLGALRAAGHDIAMRDLFEKRTVAGLAAATADAQQRPTAETTTVEPFALVSANDRARLPEGLTDAYPLSQTQAGMAVELLADEGSGNYHTVTAHRVLDGEPFSAEALQRALDLVAARHDVLRTSVHPTAYSVPMQLVHSAVGLPVRVHELTGAADEAVLEREIKEFIAAERGALFDLGTAPLLRVSALVESDEVWWLGLTLSHIVLEGWSHASLVMEILDVYRSLRDGDEPAPYQAPPVRFADFVAGELEALASDEDRAYWNGLVEDRAKFSLPAGWGEAPGRPAGPTGSRVSFEDLEEGLRALAAEAGASLKSVLHAAHLKVLGQLSGDRAFFTGLVSHARPEADGADRVYGMHLNTLPFPHEDTAATWGELVRQVFERELGMWPHRRYPLAAIQRSAGSGGRLVDVLFNYVDFHQLDSDIVDTGVKVIDSPTEFALSVHANAGRIVLAANSQMLSAANAARLAAMYRTVLEAMAEAGPGGDARGTYLPAGEHERLFGQGTTEQEASSVARRVHEVFEEQVGRTPDAVAVSFEGVELSYAELNARANRIAHVLRGRGVGPEALVGVCLERGLDLIPGILGVLKSGAGYLPLDPANPAERLAYIVGDAGAPVVLTTSALSGVLEGRYEGELLLLDQDAALFEAAPESDPEVAGSPENLIYTIYTSGSTGRPKGVALTHANVVRLLSSAYEHYVFDESDVWPLFHSYAFDVSVWEMWGALLHGGRLVVVPFAVTRSPEEFLDLLVEEEVTILNQTPTAFRSLVNAARDGDRRIRRLSLRAVVFAGEKLDVAELKPWVERRGLGRTALVNMYGITETTVHTTYHRLTKRDLDPEAGNPIGGPLSDLQVHLLNESGELVPVGVAGEIYVGGPGVARGYLGRPELTAERFVPDPFGPAGSRLYKSGDLARRLPDGKLEFLGRIDDQVKIRGFRIELGEIETALAAQPLVRDAVVVVREDEPGEKRLVAYLTAGEQAPVPGELRGALAAGLPEYMIPSAFVVLDALPLTTNGKLDKRALPAPGQDALGGSAAYTAPRTGTEERIAAVWREVLGLEKVGVEDSFFDLGGDSIRALTLVGALREEGLDLAVRDVLEHRTVARLAELVAGRGAIEAMAAVQPYALISAEDRGLLPAGTDDAYPLSQAQLGMLVEMQAGSGRNEYHNVFSMRIRDELPLDTELLGEAARRIFARHDVLRTSVDLTTYSVPLQIVHSEVDVDLEVRDLRGLDRAGVERAVREFTAQERARLFDVGSAPLMRVAAHDEGDGAWWLAFTECHVVMEGWSTFSLVMEVLDLYRELRTGAPVTPYDRPATRFADFVAAELASLASDQDRAYWGSVVAGGAKFELPAGWGDPADGERTTSYTTVPYDDLEEGLRALAARAGSTLKGVLHAAHLKVMSQLTDEQAFFTGLVTNARPEARGADRVFGMHLNTLPFLHDRLARTWRELVERTHAREVDLWEHRSFPMPEIQREFHDGRRLIDVMFTYQDFHQIDHDRIDTGATVGEGALEFGLRVSGVGGIVGLNASGQQLGQESLDRIAVMFRLVLEAMAADPEGDAQAARLPETTEWNPATTPVAPGTVLQWFEARAAEHPEAVALVHSGPPVTYGELDARANRVAHHLRDQGVTAETRVGIRLERGCDLVVAMLAAWKAGAAYIPIDPGYPAERVARMMDTAGAGLLLDRLPEPALLAGHPDTAPHRDDDPDTLAYIIFTSGSTGRPKGVEIPHRGLANHLHWAASALAGAGTTGAPLLSSHAYDLPVPNIWAPLVTGQPLTLLPADTTVADLGKRLADGAPYSFVKLTPSHLDLLAQQLTDAQAAALAPLIVVAGEPLTSATVQAWRALSPGTRLINEYGPTEASVGTSIHPVPDEVAQAVVPIGSPLPNMAMHVLDERLQKVPTGVTGELYVGGAGLARGYSGRPDLTAERFVPDPYGAAGGRLYRTGDLVRRLPDGAVEFLGRTDDQVKIRGHRVEPGEIQTVLTGHPDVTAAYVTTDEPVPGSPRLIAYYTGDGGRPVPELAGHCAAALPDHMVPAVFTHLAALPLNPNGKVDRGALPAPDTSATGEDGRTVAEPVTDTEKALAGIWAQLLGAERIGTGDNFFALGGHSMLIIKVMAAARKKRLPVSLQMLYQTETLGELAAAVDAHSAAVRANAGGAAGARKASGAAPAPATLPSMREHRVPGAVVALIRDGEVASVSAYGVLRADGEEVVTPQTLFQTGSISKHVTALGVLRLVDQGVLRLDEDVDTYLTSWRITTPDGTPAAVTLRQLLSHRSGLTLVANAGYRPGDALPTVLDLLTGSPEADNAPVHAERPAGAGFQLANTNYMVIQQVLEDVTGRPFPELMRATVFEPLRMASSGFEQDFPQTGGRSAAAGHDEEGRVVDGGWRVRPQVAASGLWSTAADLAKVVGELRRSYRGEPFAFLSRELAEQMLTPGEDSFYGLGAVVDGIAPDLEAGHGGEPHGYRNMLLGRITDGTGFVVLTNGAGGREVVKAVGQSLREHDAAFATGRMAEAWAAGPRA
ncbi:amino acid adenylation domain-containing protein [Streptomyces sp. NPDC005811]|uniref:amino acid adenylation domain-containing protein n=1 Tax=Streptomyces sp. NPDC005811 TaxID=3154565 RepID=UPI0033C51BBE